MQSHIFDEKSATVSLKPQLKHIGTKATEIGAMLKYSDGSTAEPISSKPTINRIQASDLQQLKDLRESAKVYNARRNQSAITFI